ncbi:hypothetical protein OG936_32065 [Streptomyces sp. NBC_00846]|uniref:hypothetical protein n=1 Tax=Streptomyces sp. NBC_00846 TaxID=2975849 RepID=UPI00386EC76C|nr:hypothetical protein OG936_32065 [Streptomyces sp. NBC_00846]
MIVIHPVLETGALPGFELWPVVEQPPHHLTPLNGTLSDEQVGTAIATMAGYNSSRVEDHLTDPADAFLSSLLHEEGFVAPGGLRVQDTGTGTTLTPGCCCGLEDWRGWLVACRCLVMACLVGRLVSGRFLPLCQTGLLSWVRRRSGRSG